jgi:hypothetical protein
MRKRRPSTPTRAAKRQGHAPPDAENRRRLKAAATEAAATLGEILGAFLIRAGVSPEDVSETFRALSEAALHRELRLEPEPPPDWSQISDFVTIWWRDPQYLDERGVPRDLPEYGPAPSVEHLLALTVDPDLHDRAKSVLKRAGIVVRRGLWHFDEDHAHFPLSAEQGVDRLKIATSGMYSNALENLIRQREATSRKNIDRTALVASYPVELIPELRARVRQRLQLLLEDMDGWMTTTSRSRTGGPVALVGVTAFVHTGEPRSRQTPENRKRGGRTASRFSSRSGATMEKTRASRATARKSRRGRPRHE